MKVGDLVLLKENYQIKGVYYGPGVIISMKDYPEEGFTSHKVQWLEESSFHAAHELEVISESR